MQNENLYDGAGIIECNKFQRNRIITMVQLNQDEEGVNILKGIYIPFNIKK